MGVLNIPAELMTTEALRDMAIATGVCVRPVLQRLTDSTTGESRIVPIPCGATLDSKCPPCAERARRLRIQQCREGWHLDTDPERDPAGGDLADDTAELDGDLDDTAAGDGQECARTEDEGSARSRSTRRRQDMPDLPRLPMAKTTVGRSFTGSDGTVYRPSTFLTVTMPSYGKVRPDGTPVDPSTYDYRRAALDALHFSKLWDRLVQNMRRCVGYNVQYFAAVEPQRRLAPHLHAALRGTFPRAIMREVVAATYFQLWWPQHDTPVYTRRLPVWRPNIGGGGTYVDPDTGAELPTWDQALDALDNDQDAVPAHVLTFGTQTDVQGLIGGPRADRAIGYLCKYLTKAISAGATAGTDSDEPTPAQGAHITRLHEQVRFLPCSPDCANWLRYGVQPKDAHAGMRPGCCPRKAHKRHTLGLGGRRVLVSRKWTGKTLEQHRADRRDVVRVVLEAAGIDLPEGAARDELTGDGRPRWLWEPVRPNDEPVPVVTVLAQLISQRQHWREQYERARDQQALINSATKINTAAEAA
ncbi:hypothetical protein GCM10009765_44450 [Fodinicola feengrottensis]|uniref:Replication initiation protein n=1 Tax=Fodinicola feengrottensis TaxID=435914 RepID=A0ABN2HM73_9ACTN